MKQKFYICKHSGNIIAMLRDTGTPVYCCNEEMQPLDPGSTEASGEKHIPVYEMDGSIVHVKVGSAEHPMTMKDLVTEAFEHYGVVARYRQQNLEPDYSFQCHILRLGNIAITTNPFELFHEFGQRMKARAEAEQVFIIQLSNGIGGYLPTHAAVNGGSYSSKPASTVCGPEGGDELVEKTLQVLQKLWN